MQQSETYDPQEQGGTEGPVRRDSRSLLHKIFHASPSPITISRLSDGRLLDVNEEWAAFTGYSIEEAVGKTPDELNLWESAERFIEIRSRLVEKASIHDEEITIRTHGGDLRTVVLSAQIIDVDGEDCMLQVMTDITDRKRAVQALRESEQRFHMMADSAPVLIWVADEQGTVTYFNRSWIDFTGRPLQDQVDGRWLEAVHDDDRAACKRVFEQAHAQSSAFSRQFRLRRYDGEYRWVLDNGVPRYHPDGSLAGYIGSCLDINEQKATEQALIDAKEHAEEMSQLKATFITNITHEIRTPLTVILGFTSILRQGVRTEYQRFVNLIERSGRRLLLMLDSMLDLAQLESGSLEVDARPLNVNDVVEVVLGVVRPLAAEKGLDLTTTFESGRNRARVDHAILTRVLNNILDNAIKFTDEGTVGVKVTKSDGSVHVVVTDTGVGIEEQFLPHVFDPFVQESTGLDRTHQGSGLGLSVSRRLIELMGGTIEIASKKNHGSVFTIILPAAS